MDEDVLERRLDLFGVQHRDTRCVQGPSQGVPVTAGGHQGVDRLAEEGGAGYKKADHDSVFSTGMGVFLWLLMAWT